MSIDTPEVATRLAAIDSASISDGHPYDADTLRVLAMQANRMRVEPSTIVNFAVDVGVDPDTGRSFQAAATPDWRLLLPTGGPRRPGHNRATVRLALVVELNNSIEFGFRCPPDTEIQPTGTINGTGSLVRSNSAFRLPLGLSWQPIQVYIRAKSTGPLANSTTIGGANTVAVDYRGTASPFAVISKEAATVTGASYDLAVIGDGTYSVRAVTATGGTTLWERRITHATLGDVGAGGQVLWFEQGVSAAEVTQTNNYPGGANIEIREWSGRTSVAGLTIVGERA